MSDYSKIFRRSWSLLLAVAILFTAIGPVWWSGVSADVDTESKTAGKIIAENYELTEAEEQILKSGYLIGDSYEFNKPTDSDNLISVDLDSKTITAKSFTDASGNKWSPVKAFVVDANENTENVTLTDGKGTYAYDGDAFSVKVDYEVTVEIDEATQSAILNAPAALKQAIANMGIIASGESSSQLGTIEAAMGVLQQLANGIDLGWASAQLKEPAINAVNTLNAQIKDIGNFYITKLVEEYTAADSKVEYVVVNRQKVIDTIKDAYTNLSIIATDVLLNNELLDGYLNSTDQASYTKWMAFKSVINTWCATNEPVANDAWIIADAVYLRDDLTSVAYAALDVMVAELGDTTTISTIKNPLVLSSKTLTYNMSMSDVTVKVVIKTASGVVGSNELVVKDENTTVITLADGTTKDEILDAVAASGIVADSINEWGDMYIANQFEQSTTDLPDTITKDIEYVITYSPKYYTLIYLGAESSVPYGYKLMLEPHSDATKAYDYSVNGSYYAEGSVYTVVGNTNITRSEGKSYVTSNLKDIANDRYFEYNGKQYLILKSDAVVVGDRQISVRYPDNKGNIVTVNDGQITANKYHSSYAGLDWVPYTYTVVTDSGNFVHKFDGTTATITEADYNRVEVIYRLVLSNIPEDEILEILKVPGILSEDAANQKAALDRLGNYADQMAQLDKTKLGALNGVIDVTDLHSDPAKSDELKAYFKSVVTSIINNCLDGSQLKIYTMLSAYLNEYTGGLEYYYKNSEAIINEINILSGYLTAMFADDEKVAALEVLVEAAGFPEYAEKIQNLEKAMKDVKEALTPPSEYIDTESADLGNLIDALLMSGDASQYTYGELYLESEAIIINAQTKVNISASVQVQGGRPISIDPITFDRNHVINEEDIAKIVNAIKEKIAELGIDTKYYNTDYTENYFDSFVGKAAKELDSSYSFIWTPIKYTVNIEGSSSVEIDVNNLTISLPAGNATTRYEYIIDGQSGLTSGYKFTLEQIDRLFDNVNREYTVFREEINIQRENLVNMVNDLNSSVTNGAVRFALIEKDGKYSIVLKVNADNMNNMMSAMQEAAMGLVNSGYSYIGLDGKGLLYLDDESVLTISMQAVVDAVMNSGFGSDTLISAMDANGNIKNLVLDGDVISNAVLNALGGQLVKTTMQLGNSSSDNCNVDFYITLGSASDMIVKLRNLLADELAPYFSFVCEDGQTKISLTLPEKAYEAYLAVLLATDNVDITDINSLNGEIAIGFAKDIIEPLLTGNVTTQTIENTLNMLGYKLNLTGYETVFQAICDAYKTFTFTYEEQSTTAVGNIAIADIIDKLNMGDLGKMIAEYDTGLDITLNVALENLGNRYNGLYFDINAEGITNKIGLTKDIASKLNTLSGTSLVVLLSDIDASSRLVFNNTTVLNLNGQRVSGNIIANGNLTIIDTTLTTGECGRVDGVISGNVTIVSGQYDADVTDYLKTGYSQNDDGVVINDIYTIVKDSDGNVTVEIDAGLLATEALPNLKAVAVDIVSELIFNGYTVNKLYIDGNKVYDITIEDFVGLYAGEDTGKNLINKITEMVDSNELEALINTVLADITDFATIENAINSDTPILSYDMTTGSWNIKLEHVEDGDYLTGSIDSSNEKTNKLNILVTGTEEDKQLLADIFGALDDTTDVDVSVDLNQGFDSNNDKNFVLDWNASGSVIVDLTENPDYAIMIAVMIADGLSAQERADLVAGIEAYYTTYTFTELEKAFNNLKISQVIKALKNITKDDSFEEMIANLGLKDIVEADVVELEKLFDAIAKLVAAVARKLNITGNDRLIGSFVNADGTYTVSKENIGKEIFIELIRGYGLTVDLDITKVYISIDIFGVTAPEFIDGTGTPEVGTHDKIVGSLVDTENKIIYLDAHYLGVKIGDLKDLFTFYAKYADSIEIVIGDGNTNAIVCNGTKLIATASNAAGLKATIEYTIVIVGDVNGNGRIESGDAVLINQSLAQLKDITDIQKLAADINNNGRIDIGDATKVARKLVYWDEYESSLVDTPNV
ncbi:MAG: hypothetical protein E7385_04875 [Ruminococcaceae bacterium]|nr:hypothetical protein [Oscillospiraceae bacterium]